MHLIGGSSEDDFVLMANMEERPVRFEIPRAAHGKRWTRFVDTSLDSPEDVSEVDAMPVLIDPGTYAVAGRSVVLLVAR
jgi:pullulanase/glycogen debranching enzyme